MEEFVYFSPLGTLNVVLDGGYLVGIGFGGKGRCEIAGEVRLWLDEYFAGKSPDVKRLKFRIDGTEFQKRVWDALLDIPYGTLVSYGEVARILEQKYGYARMSPRAVGGAVHKNPIAIIVPCHRVVGASGKLVGYAYGTDKKQALIDFEKRTK